MRLIREHSEIKLVILDINMPGLNGFEVLELLNSDALFEDIRAIILTNSDEPENEINSNINNYFIGTPV